MMRWLLALALLLAAPSAEARSSSYQSYNVAGRSAQWQGFSPTWIPGLALWLRADLGVTAVAGPVTATGTTPPTVTLAGTPTAAQTAAATPYVELDCTTLGTLGTSKYTLKLNGAVVATNVASASSGVSIPGSGLTAGWAAGASAVNDVYTANVVASAWGDHSGLGHNLAQATASKQPIVAATDGPAGGAALSFDGTAQVISGYWTEAQPVERYVVGKYTVSGATGTLVDGPGGNAGRVFRITTSSLQFFAGAQSGRSFTSTIWNAIGALFNGSSSLSNLNGSVGGTISLGASSPGGVSVGAYGAGAADYAPCEIAEVIDFSRSIGTNDQARLNGYFQARYTGGL